MQIIIICSGVYQLSFWITSQIYESEMSEKLLQINQMN